MYGGSSSTQGGRSRSFGFRLSGKLGSGHSDEYVQVAIDSSKRDITKHNILLLMECDAIGIKRSRLGSGLQECYKSLSPYGA